MMSKGTLNQPQAPSSVLVEAACGQLRGLATGGVCAFKGIPYAQPPTGRSRWAPPRRREPWAGVHDATASGACAPQNPSLVDLVVPGQIGAQSEDCLHLDIWTPNIAGRAPVMV